MKKSQRLQFILFILVSLGLAVGLALYALKDNIAFFYTPHEVTAKPELIGGQKFRLGGLVKDGSLKTREDDMAITFIVTDDLEELTVEYTGLLPDLFREGQGVVATGTLNTDGVFVASDLLAKHDEKYMPPELAKSLEKAAKQRRQDTP